MTMPLYLKIEPLDTNDGEQIHANPDALAHV